MNNPLIFLTGCINPNNMSHTVIQDIETRKQHYLDSIKYYLGKTGLPILFVENSGNDLSGSFKPEIKSGRLEILTFAGNDFDRLLGKGYGEMLILEHAVLFSRLFREANFVFKISGRYKVLNIGSYTGYYNKKKDAFDMLINLGPNLSRADSRFFGASVSFYKEIFIKYKDMVNDSKSVYFEHVLAKAVHESILKGYKYSGLNFCPRYSAVSGTEGRVYNDSWLYWAMREIIYRLLNKIQAIMKIT